MENSTIHRIRIRSHSVLLSAGGYTIEETADIFQVKRDTVSSWSDRWEKSGISGQADMPSGGRPPILTEKELEKVLESVKNILGQ